MSIVGALLYKSSKDDWEGRRWQQPAVQYILVPPEGAVITLCIVKYRKKVSLKQILKILVKSCYRNEAMQKTACRSLMSKTDLMISMNKKLKAGDSDYSCLN